MKWTESGKPATVFFPYYYDFDISKFHKEYHSLHGDSHSGSYNVPRWYRKYKNKKLSRKFKEYTYREFKGLPEKAIPKFVKDAYYDYI